MCTGTHPYIPVNNTAKVEQRFVGPGGVMENVYYFHQQDALLPADLEAIADLIDLWETNHGKALRSVDVRQTEIKVTDLSTSTSPTFTLPASTVGTAPGAVLPSNVTVAAKFRSGSRGRSATGRHFWIGLTETMVTGDALAPATAVAIEAAYSEMMTSLGAQGFQLVNVSLCSNHVWRTTGQIYPVIAVTVDTTTDSQRRRLFGRGR